MKAKLKVMTVVGTRPEIIRLSRVMAALDQSEAIEHIIVHTGQNYDYELNQIFFDDLGIRKPDFFLDAAGATATETVGQILIKIDPLLANEQPDAFLVLGDTNSCLCAIPAKKRHIPIFHMEAGNRCFDQRVPEETNRKIVDHVSDINLTYSSIAREYLLREGDICNFEAYVSRGCIRSYFIDENGFEKVKSFFVAAGLSEERVQVEGFGERRHVAPNDTALERKKNRRVVLQLTKP